MQGITHVLAGVSRGDITPQPGLVLQGHWGAPPSSSVLGPLEVRAIVLESGHQKAAIATIDVIGVTRQTTDRIRSIVERTCGIPADSVMVVCSHTHCAPATLPCMGLDPSADWIERIEADVARCIGRAQRTLCPVMLGLGYGATHFNMSRRPAASLSGRVEPVDRRTRVLRIDREDGSILATIFHYACHATALSGLRGLISPDYPGVARDLIERAVGGTVLFLPGSGGDLRPRLDDLAVDNAEAASSLDVCGRMLGEEVCRIVESIETRAWRSLHTARTDVNIPFGAPFSTKTLHELIGDESDLGRRLGRPWAQRVLQLIAARDVPLARPTEMQTMTIGPLTCVGIPGEPLQAVGLVLEEGIVSPPGSAAIWPVGYANDQIGYLCTTAQYEEGGYETTAYVFYNEPAPFCGEERVILDTATRLLAPVSDVNGNGGEASDEHT